MNRTVCVIQSLSSEVHHNENWKSVASGWKINSLIFLIPKFSVCSIRLEHRISIHGPKSIGRRTKLSGPWRTNIFGASTSIKNQLGPGQLEGWLWSLSPPLVAQGIRRSLRSSSRLDPRPKWLFIFAPGSGQLLMSKFFQFNWKTDPSKISYLCLVTDNPISTTVVYKASDFGLSDKVIINYETKTLPED